MESKSSIWWVVVDLFCVLQASCVVSSIKGVSALVEVVCLNGTQDKYGDFSGSETVLVNANNIKEK